MDKAFVKGLRLIEAPAVSESSGGVTDLASELEPTKSSVHRLQTTLQANGYVRQVAANGTNELTTRIRELGSQGLCCTNALRGFISRIQRGSWVA